MASLSHLILWLSCFLTCFAPTLQANTPGYYTTPKTTMNVVDSCWRTKSDWATNRRALADCAVGFGKNALGGKYGRTYVVTTSYDDPVNPQPGSLRYGVIQTQPLWIVFAKDMVITLKNELIMNSFKTIDGRGAKVEIAYGPCITVQGISHVIIHGISIHDCKRGKGGNVRSTPTHVGQRRGCDGDAIAVFASSHVWIDHCFLARSSDGLVDVTHASTAVTVTNNYFYQHDKVSYIRYTKYLYYIIPLFMGTNYFNVANNRVVRFQVMLLGHNDNFSADKNMRVTIAFNRFGAGLIERMPR